MTFGFPQGRSDYEPAPEGPAELRGSVSSGFREIESGWNQLESVGHVAPFVAPVWLATQFSLPEIPVLTYLAWHPQQRLAFLDDLDQIRCIASDPERGFEAGEDYAERHALQWQAPVSPERSRVAISVGSGESERRPAGAE